MVDKIYLAEITTPFQGYYRNHKALSTLIKNIRSEFCKGWNVKIFEVPSVYLEINESHDLHSYPLVKEWTLR